MGRNPTPTKLKILNGNPGKRPLNHHEPQPISLDPQKKPYSWLSLSLKAKEIFETVLPLVPSGHLSALDEFLFARWCELQVDRSELREFIGDNGRTIELFDAKGNLRTIKNRPEVSDLRAIEIEIRSCESQMGFSPSSRSKVVCIGDSIIDDDDNLFFGS